MTGKPGMNKSGKMGGRRPGAGRPYKFSPKKGEIFIMERSCLTTEHNEITEIWYVLGVSDQGNTLEFQCGNDIITIRRPDPDEIFGRES